MSLLSPIKTTEEQEEKLVWVHWILKQLQRESLKFSGQLINL